MAKKIREFNFRELDKSYIFVHNPILAKAMEPFFDTENSNGLIVYGYNDHIQGLGFEVLAAANLDNGRLQLGKGNNDISLQLKVSDILEEEAITLPRDLPVWGQFADKQAIVEAKHCVNEEILATRNVVNLDACRSLIVPDEVSVQLVKGELIETCQVRLEGIQKLFIVGILLQEPNSAFGIHEGDSLSFYNVKNEQGIMCMAVFSEN